MYTALTRQTDKIIVLHQGPPGALRALASPFFSETARRLTNLFSEPDPIDVLGPAGAEDLTKPGEQRRFLEHKLIHRSGKGEALSSKSEVIIADALAEAEREIGIRYQAERGLRSLDGVERWPDFTIDHPSTGRTYYWEHLGLLGDEEYAQRWRRKLSWYREQGITSYSEDPEKGRLIITRDGQGIGIDSSAIRRLIQEVWAKRPTGADLELFEPEWHKLIQALVATQGVSVEPGEDVSRDDVVIGSYLARVTFSGRVVHLIDSSSSDSASTDEALRASKQAVLTVSLTDEEWTGRVRSALGIDGES